MGQMRVQYSSKAGARAPRVRACRAAQSIILLTEHAFNATGHQICCHSNSHCSRKVVATHTRVDIECGDLLKQSYVRHTKSWWLHTYDKVIAPCCKLKLTSLSSVFGSPRCYNSTT